MSKRKKRRRRDSPMPAARAGLLRLFEEEIPGIKVKPRTVIIIAIVFVVVGILAHLYL